MLHIFIDADGCPVKDEIYRVALRYKLRVTLVSNTWMRAPVEPWLDQVTVPGDFNAADNWIVEHVEADDIVITGDIPLAARCLPKGAAVLDHRGGHFTEETIGQAMATRDLMSHLRTTGAITGGPAPKPTATAPQFLQRLDETIQAIRRRK